MNKFAEIVDMLLGEQKRIDTETARLDDERRQVTQALASMRSGAPVITEELTPLELNEAIRGAAPLARHATRVMRVTTKRKRLSAETRAKMAEGQRRRFAAQRAAA